MNCATCDSRTISCAPFLISLSSSGNRNDSVSRESSVHSMMSMNCFLMKSMIAIARVSGVQVDDAGGPALLFRREPLRLGLALHDFGLDSRRGQRAGNDRAVREDERGRGRYAQLLAERVGCRNRIFA